jgi:hypothetical protein
LGIRVAPVQESFCRKTWLRSRQIHWSELQFLGAVILLGQYLSGSEKIVQIL